MNVILEQIDLVSARLAPALDGFRILFFSDLHYGCRGRRIRDEAAGLIGDTACDLLVFGGDVIDHTRWWPKAAEWLAHLAGPPTRLAVPGNWDYMPTGECSDYERRMRDTGFLSLCNAAHRVRHGGGELQVIGIEDVKEGKPDVERAFRTIDPEEFTVVVCHSPDILLSLDPGRFDLLLCGHTHGGQIRLPGFGAVVTRTKLGKQYEAGLYEVSPGRHLYVSRGLGSGLIKLRVNCPPELVLIALKRIESHGNGLP